MAKRGLELLGQLKTHLSPGSKDRKIEVSHEDLKDLIKELGREDFSASSSPPSSSSTTAGSSSNHSSPMGAPATPRVGGGKAGGRGAGGGGGKKQIRFRKEASDREKIGMLETMMLMVFRLLLVHEAEHRRVARELNDILEFGKKSTAPAKMDTQKTVWASEIPKKTEENPFPQHPERTWRIDAWICLFTMVKALVDEKGPDLCGDQLSTIQDAIKTLTNQGQLAHGLLRFYRVKSFKEDGDDSGKEMWVVRFSATPVGHKLRAAFALLESSDLLEAAWGETHHRPDRAPRGNMVREMEACLDDALGK